MEPSDQRRNLKAGMRGASGVETQTMSATSVQNPSLWSCRSEEWRGSAWGTEGGGAGGEGGGQGLWNREEGRVGLKSGAQLDAASTIWLGRKKLGRTQALTASP